MKASKILKKQMIIESFALVFLVLCILYSYFMITGSKQNIQSQEGMVTVLDDSSFHSIQTHSDGAGLQTGKTTYTVTNNNKGKRTYKVILETNLKEEDLAYIKVGIDELYSYSFDALKKEENGYVLTTYTLDSGFTKVHSFQYWLDKQSSFSLIEDVSMSYRLEFE